MGKGQIWISAALYIAIGIIVLSILLGAGLPILNDLRDKNIVLSTKELLINLDNTIRETFEGPGSQREFFLDIKNGDFLIDSVNDKFIWSIETGYLASEPGVVINEGTLEISTESLGDKYKVTLTLPFKDGDLITQPEVVNLKGKYDLIIRNNGNREIEITGIS